MLMAGLYANAGARASALRGRSPWRHTREGVFAVTARGRRPWEGLPRTWPGSHFSSASSRGDGALASAGASARHAAQPWPAPRAAGQSGASCPTVQPPARIQTSRSQRTNRAHASYQPEGAAQKLTSSAVPRGRAASRGAASAHARRVPAAAAVRAAGTVRGVTTAGERAAGRSKRNIVSYVLIGIGVASLLVAAGIFIWAQLGYRQAAETYQATQHATVDSEGDGIPVVDWDALQAQTNTSSGVLRTRYRYQLSRGAGRDQR